MLLHDRQYHSALIGSSIAMCKQFMISFDLLAKSLSHLPHLGKSYRIEPPPRYNVYKMRSSVARNCIRNIGRPSLTRSYVSPSKTAQATALGNASLDQKTLSEAEFAANHSVTKDESTIGAPAQRPIYLDMQATTPIDPRVNDKMLPYFLMGYGNPHSKTHWYGWEAEKAIEESRKHVASLIGADPKEIIFTSGATESNNMIIKGVARFYGKTKKHIITTQTEHKCVLDSCRVLQDDGFEVTYLPVKQNGLIDMAELEAAMRPDTCLVSIMSVNNEIGVIQPVDAIGKLCRSKKIFFHTDGAQAVGKVPVDVNKSNIDLMSISGHKIYGPKGIGAAYVRRRPRVRLEPLINGGGQERGLRSGTLPTPLVVGFGEACKIAKRELMVSTSLCDDNAFQSKLEHHVP